MMKVWLLMILASVAMGATEEITFEAADGVKIYGEIYQNEGATLDAPLVMLFHQGGGDSRGEYEPLVGRLLEAGYIAVAIDQRNGGERFGGVNRTMAGLGKVTFGYCQAYPDLEATLKYVVGRGYTGKRAAWGSSYSAALVFQLAADHGAELDAILAFSPANGKALADCLPGRFSADLKLPVLALRPSREMGNESTREQLAMFEKQGHQTFVADPGVHGSSMLNAERVGESTEKTWLVVLEFLAENIDKKDQ